MSEARDAELERLRAYVGTETLRSDFQTAGHMRAELERLRNLLSGRARFIEVERLRAENERLNRIIEPIRNSVINAEALGRKVDDWVTYAKALEYDAPGAVGVENKRLRARVTTLKALLRELVQRKFTANSLDLQNRIRAALEETE